MKSIIHHAKRIGLQYTASYYVQFQHIQRSVAGVYSADNVSQIMQ